MEIVKFGGNCEVVNICENLGTSGNIWEHLGTSRNILEHLGTLIRLDRNTQSYMWIGWIGSLKHLHTRAPLCGAKNILPIKGYKIYITNYKDLDAGRLSDSHILMSPL